MFNSTSTILCWFRGYFAHTGLHVLEFADVSFFDVDHDFNRTFEVYKWIN